MHTWRQIPGVLAPVWAPFHCSGPPPSKATKQHKPSTLELACPCFLPRCYCGMLCRGNLGERPRSAQCDFLGFPGKICCGLWNWEVHSRVPWQIKTGWGVQGKGCSLSGLCSGSWPSKSCQEFCLRGRPGGTADV